MLTPMLAQSDHFDIDTVLSPYVYVFIAAYLLSFAFTPIMRRVAEFYGIIDKPDLLRKMHSRPVAYLGGVAVFLGWAAGLAITQLLGLHGPVPQGVPTHNVVPLPMILAALIIIALGLLDDVKSLNPKIKIFE